MVWRRALIWSGTGSEWGEVVECEGGVILKCRRVGVGRVEAGEARCRHPVARCLSFHSRRLQAVAEGHEFIDLGDDAVLFGKGGQGKVYEVARSDAC